MSLRAACEFYHLKEIFSPAEILTEHKFLGLILKVHCPIVPARLINDPVDVFLSYISVYRRYQQTGHNMNILVRNTFPKSWISACYFVDDY